MGTTCVLSISPPPTPTDSPLASLKLTFPRGGRLCALLQPRRAGRWVVGMPGGGGQSPPNHLFFIDVDAADKMTTPSGKRRGAYEAKASSSGRAVSHAVTSLPSAMRRVAA
eukprot:scaffold72200_cov31-Tisochrysis_lutea.AAC.3